MIHVGLAGVGFMGWIHWLGYKLVPGAKMSAISTRDAKRRSGDWRGIQGNFGPPGGQVGLSGVQAFERPEGLLSHPSIHPVGPCLPPHPPPDAGPHALPPRQHLLLLEPFGLTA